LRRDRRPLRVRRRRLGRDEGRPRLRAHARRAGEAGRLDEPPRPQARAEEGRPDALRLPRERSPLQTREGAAPLPRPRRGGAASGRAGDGQAELRRDQGEESVTTQQQTKIESVPLLDLKRQVAELEPELREAFERVLKSGHYILGPEVQA